MIPYANLRPGPGFRFGRVGLYYAQRFAAVAPWLRQSIGRTIASTIARNQGTVVSRTPLAQRYAGVVSTLRERGIATLPGFISDNKTSRIFNYLQNQDVLLADGRHMPISQVPSNTRLRNYSLTCLLNNSDVLSLITAAPVLRIASDYLGCKPTLSGLSAYWSFPTDEPPLYTQPIPP